MVWDATVAITVNWHRPPEGKWLQFEIRTAVLSDHRHEVRPTLLVRMPRHCSLRCDSSAIT
jgi:hypothetical protein